MTIEIRRSTATDRSAIGVAALRKERDASYAPRAHADAEARGRANAIAAWERLYGEPVPWSTGWVTVAVTHRLNECSYQIRVESR